MDVEGEEYLARKQQRGTAIGCKRFLWKRMGSALRSPTYVRLTPLQVLSERVQTHSLSRVEPRIISSLFPNRSRGKCRGIFYVDSGVKRRKL